MDRVKRYLFISLIVIIAFIFKAYYDTNSIEIRQYKIENSPLGMVLNGYKIAHLSDLHFKNLGGKENKIIEILKKEKPDLIFITGDFIHFKGPYDLFLAFLQKLDPIHGVYCVLGNTEYSNENGSCILCHKNGSTILKENDNQRILRNSSLSLKLNDKLLNVIGVDDPVDKRSDLPKAINNVDIKNPSILLAHSPEIFEEASNFGFDLILCGHNHGGQIFITKYLKEVIPLDPTLEFIEGFYQKGKTLMYVNRGIGTSYLPFRFGIKPEITFFEFTDNKPQTYNLKLLTMVGPSNPLIISNHIPKTIFAGFSLSDLIKTFNIFTFLSEVDLTQAQNHGSTATPQNSSIATQQNNSTVLQQYRSTAGQYVFFDFESNEELNYLNWECHKWFELSDEHATSGKYSLKVILPPGQYPGIDFQEIKKDWSKGISLKMDIFNPESEEIPFHIRIDDHKSGWEYAKRFDIQFSLKKGLNQINISNDMIKTNIGNHPLNLKNIKRFIVFIPNNPKKRILFLDNIRLE